jgi:hypothetical protein
MSCSSLALSRKSQAASKSAVENSSCVAFRPSANHLSGTFAPMLARGSVGRQPIAPTHDAQLGKRYLPGEPLTANSSSLRADGTKPTRQYIMSQAAPDQPVVANGTIDMSKL